MLRSMRMGLALVACGALCALPLYGQNAKTLRAQAETESNQEKQVLLLCKAADLEPKNAEFRRDCDISKSALISADKQALKTAQDALDGGQTVKAGRYARYVSSLDPDLHRQAEQLLMKLAAAANPPPQPPPNPPPGPNQAALLAQAVTAYQGGNLTVARSTAQSITDASLKPAASQIVSDIDRYSGLVTKGQQLEQTKKYAEAASSFQEAQAINGHVAADNLAGRIQSAQQQAAALAAASRPPGPVAPPPPIRTATNDTKPKVAPVESPEDKKKRLLNEARMAMGRHDWDAAGRVYKEVQAIDASNAEARSGLEQASAALATALKDPVVLENTLRDAIKALYASKFEDAESRFNHYLRAEGGRKKGAAYFYLGVTEMTMALLDDSSRRAPRTREAQEDFGQARKMGYRPVEQYVSARVLGVWNSGGS